MVLTTLTNALTDIRQKYELLEVLGSGSFGIVRKCQNKQTGELAAVKTIQKERVDDITMLQREIELLREVHHPNIIQLYDIYEDDTSLHLVTELCTGGELYDKVVEKAESEQGHFSEEDAACLIRDILDAIRYCHDELNIVHRDLKPENFLLKDDNDDHLQVKIIDFGLSRRNDAPFGIMTTRVGTPYYVAPEVLNHNYDYKCDIWSIGVIAYILLCGFAPFSGDDDLETLRLVQTAKLTFPSPEWDVISEEAQDFCKSLLQRDANQRPTAKEALKHPWVAKYISTVPGIPEPRPFASFTSSDSNSMPIMGLDSTRRSAFQKFLASLKVSKAISGAVHVLTPAEAQQLGEIFKRVDRDQDGRISEEDLDAAVRNEAFSASVRRRLNEVRAHLHANPRIAFDIRPYIHYVDKRAKPNTVG